MNSIKNWAEDDRPREKLMLKGEHVLSNAELLAIVLGSGTKRHSALDIAQLLLKDAENNFNSLQSFGRTQLKSYSGIGDAKAILISAVMEIVKRSQFSSNQKITKINSSKDAFTCLQPLMLGLEHEEFFVIYLNRGNAILACEQISKGGVSGTVADGKIIFSKALKYKASAMILAHNHPSGQLRPSEADKKLTKSLSEFGRYIDIQILDHLILANNNYLSFADEGFMSN
jgi:DNA repair protein RadC